LSNIFVAPPADGEDHNNNDNANKAGEICTGCVQAAASKAGCMQARPALILAVKTYEGTALTEAAATAAAGVLPGAPALGEKLRLAGQQVWSMNDMCCTAATPILLPLLIA